MLITRRCSFSKSSSRHNKAQIHHSFTYTHPLLSIFLEPRITSLSVPISCRCIDVASAIAAAKGGRDHCNRGKSGDTTREGKSTPNAISHVEEKRYSRASDSPGNLLRESSPRDTCARGDLFFRDRENWKRCCVRMCEHHVRFLNMYRVRVRNATDTSGGEGGTSASVLAKEAREIPGID